MGDPGTIAWITAISILGAAAIGGGFKFAEMLYRNKLEKRRARNKLTLKDVAKYAMEMDKIIFNIMDRLGASRITLSQFHNGGEFIGGIPIDKMSITNEVFSSDNPFPIPLKENRQNVLLGENAAVMYEILLNDKYFKPNVNDCEAKLRKELKQAKVESVYKFLIKSLNGTPVGFLSITYHKKTDLSSTQISYVWRHHNEILNIINCAK